MSRDRLETAQLDTEHVCAEIADGRHDLGAIQKAIAACIQSHYQSTRWVIDFDLLEDLPLAGPRTEGDLTLGQVNNITRAVAGSWAFALDTNPMFSAEHCVAVIDAFLAEEVGDPDERAAMIEALNAQQVMDAIDNVAVFPADPS